MMFSLEVYPYQRTTDFSDAPNPMFRTMRSTVYLCSSAVGFCQRLRLLDGDVVAAKIDFACGRVCFWGWCDKVVDVGTAGAWDT